jgi:hypothetical protein
VNKNGIIHVRPTDVRTRNLWQKAESILLQETHTFWARNMVVHVRRTSSLECQRYEKQDKKLNPRAAEKGAKKLVSKDFAKILEYESSN